MAEVRTCVAVLRAVYDYSGVREAEKSPSVTRLVTFWTKEVHLLALPRPALSSDQPRNLRVPGTLSSWIALEVSFHVPHAYREGAIRSTKANTAEYVTWYLKLDTRAWNACN